MKQRTLRLLPRQQHFLDLARQFPEADTASVETYLYFLRVAGDIFDQQQAFFERFELSEGKLVVLLLLRQAPHYRMTPSALADAAHVSRGTITGLLAGLERSGLVKRAQHPEDARMFSIELTDSARDLFDRLLPERVHRIVAFMTSLTQEEQHSLRAILEKMEQHLDAISTS